MSKSMRSEVFLTPNFRSSFVHVFEPKTTQSGKQKYSICAMIPKTEDITPLQQIVVNLAAAKWPENYQAILAQANPIKDGDTVPFVKGPNVGKLKKQIYPEMAGHWIIDMSSNQKPGLVDHNVQPILDQADFRSGHWAHAKCNAFTYDNQNVGIGIGVNVIQKVPANGRDESPLGSGGGGAMSAANEFAPIAADPSMAPVAPVPAIPQAVLPAQAPANPVAGMVPTPTDLPF